MASSSSSPAPSSRDLNFTPVLVVKNAPLCSNRSAGEANITCPSHACPVCGSVSSPAYSAQVPPDEAFLGGTPAAALLSPLSDTPPSWLFSFRYYGASPSLVINSKQTGVTTFPAFGRNGLIDAKLQVDGGLRPGDSIQLVARNVLCRGGSPSQPHNSCLQIQGDAASRLAGSSRVSRRFLLHTRYLHTIVDDDKGSLKSEKSAIYPVSFQSPVTIEESNEPLPPTFYFGPLQVAATVQDSLRIMLKRAGLL
ncbi:hypothetical protein FRB96_009378 [Tulasnella sp. 330]|nr:hypothetical protein FRB96_009378 [Tulasnella sp. 330]